MKRLPNENKYQLDIKDQFKNEFEVGQLQGNNFHMTDSADLPMYIEPQGNIEQVVVEEIPGTTVSGELINITDGDSTKEVKAVIDGNSYQDTSEASINICPDTIEYWESGDYDVSTGEKTYNVSRIRLKELLKVTPSTEDYFNHHFTGNTELQLNWVLRGYDKDKKFVISIGAVSNNTSYTIPENVEYLGVGLYNNKLLDTDTFETYETIFNSGELKPFICLNSETDKTYVAFAPNKPSTEYSSDIEVIESVNRIGKATLRSTNRGVTLTNNEDGSFTLNGTSTDSIYIDFETNIKEAGDYKIAFNKNQLISSFGGDVRFIFKKDNTTINDTTIINKQNYSVTLQDNNLPNRSYIWLNKGNTFDNVTFYPSVTKGIVNKPYLPYGHIGLLQRGKNFFDLKDEVTDLNYSGIKLTTNKNRIKYNGTNTIGDAINPNGWGYAPLKYNLPAGNYIFSLKKISGSYNKNGVTDAMYLRDEDKKPIKDFSTFAYFIENNHQVKFTNPKAQTVYFQHYCNAGITFDNLEIEIQIEKDNGSATEIEEPKSKVIPIDLQGNTLAKVGDIKDLLNIGLDGSVKIGDKVGRYVFTGDEFWYLSTSWVSNTTNVFYSNMTINAKFEKQTVIYQKSNYFKGETRDKVMNTEKDLICYSGTMGAEITSVTIRIDKTIAPTVEDFKSWLKEKYNSGKPVYMDYVLAKSETINLPSIEPIKLFEGTNNFELVTNLDTTINMTYNHVGYSPSIVKPSEVKGVSGHYDTVVGNENLITDVLQNTNINPNGMLSYLNGFTVYIARVTKGKKYRINTHSALAIQVRAFYTTKPNNSTISYDNTRIVEDTLSFTSPIDGYVAFRTDSSHTNLMLYEGEDIRTHYTPHQEQTFPIDLPIGKVLYNEKAVVELTDAEIEELGLEKAELYFRDEWVKEYITNNSTVSRGITINRNSRFVFKPTFKPIQSEVTNQNYEIYSNVCKSVTLNQTYLETEGLQYEVGSDTILIYLEDAKALGSGAEFKVYAEEKGMYVVYKLAKPIYTPIKDEKFIKQYRDLQRAFSYYPVTNINSYRPTTSVADLKLYVEYFKSNKITNK